MQKISILNGLTIDQVQIGDQATMSKTLSEADGYLFASLTGSINPLYLDELFAHKTEFGHRIIPEMLIGLMFPATQGNFLPGDGNVHLKQHLDFLKPVYIGDTITVVIEIKDKIIEKNRVIIKNTAYNQDGEIVVTGEAVVWPKKDE